MEQIQSILDQAISDITNGMKNNDKREGNPFIYECIQYFLGYLEEEYSEICSP